MKKVLLLALSLLAFLVDAQETKETHVMPRFNGIEVGGAVEVFLRMGEGHEVIVVTEDDFHDKVELDVRGGVLEVEIDGPNWGETPTVKLYITAEEISEIDASGACTIRGKNTISGKFLNLELGGACTVELRTEVGLLDLDVSGASDIKLKGKAQKLTMELSGASDLFALDLEVEKATVEMSGASSARVHVTTSLSCDLSGAANLKLKGNPDFEFKEVSGAADLDRI